MRLLKIMLLIIVSGILAVPFSSCASSKTEDAKPAGNVATVQRGNLTIDITAAGNLALSRTEDLAFDLFYGQSGASGTKGTVGEVLVKEGDTVTEGQVLVTVDKDEWNDELSALEDQVTAKERDLVQAKINLQTASQNLKNSRDNVAAKELAVLNAQISLDTAKDNLSEAIKTYGWAEFDPIEAELNRAKSWYERVSDMISDMNSDLDDSLLILERAKERLDVAQAAYDNFLIGHGNEKIDLKKKQVTAAEMSLAAAQEDLADVNEDVTLKELQVTLTEGKVKDAEKALADAQEDLEQAKNKKPEITAPFAGFITKVNVEGGDEVVTGTVAIQLADPEKFEAEILVSEMDILQVKPGMEAWVDVDAMQGMSLPATVTHIAPTATIQSGVVNYEVTVEVQSLEAVVRGRQEAMQQAMADIAAGELPAPLQQAIEEGRITQEQAEEMIKQGPPPGMTPPAGMDGAAGEGGQATSAAGFTVPEDFQLREGLTVTVTIIVEEKTDILLVPNAAITSKAGQSHVQVATASGATEERTIQTGVSDFQFTEVTDGLSESEQVIVPEGTTTSTTTAQGPPRMGLFGPRPR